jgi:hypothetical protein
LALEGTKGGWSDPAALFFGNRRRRFSLFYLDFFCLRGWMNNRRSDRIRRQAASDVAR